MTSGQPLVAAELPATPSTVASLSPLFKPDVQDEMEVAIRTKRSLHAQDASSRLNKFGTTDKTCATPGCDWVVEGPGLSDLCVVCEQKKWSDMEKERVQKLLRKRAKDGSVRSTCGLCSRAVILPSAVSAAKYIICTICERKMLTTNPTPAPAVISTSTSELPSPSQPKGQPNGQPPLTISIKPRPNPASARTGPPLTIKLPPPTRAPSTMGTPSTATPTSAEARSKPPNAKAAPRRRTSRRMSTAKAGPSFPNEFPMLLTRWTETENAIQYLSATAHFNDKGEYLMPCLPVLSTAKRVAATELMTQAPAVSPVTSPSVMAGSPMGALKQISKFPIFDYQGRNSSTSSDPASPNVPKEAQSPSDPERPRLTLRLPSLSSLKITDTTTPQLQPRPSPSAASPSIPSPTTRLCRQVGCKAMLPPTYQWIFCGECLQKPLKSLSPLDEEATPRISRRVSEPMTHQDQDRPASPRRASEPTVARVAEPKNPSVRIPQLLKPAIASSDGKKDVKKNDPAIRCALPTPPPSSRQSSPTTLRIPSDPPSSPEVPLCSPDAPRYTKQNEKEDDIWDDDLSDLTPLESSDNSDSSDEEEDAKPADAERGRVAEIRSGSQRSVCIRSRCHNLLVPWSKWKMCLTCRLKFRERSRERKDSLMFTMQGEAGAVGDGTSQRKCALRACKNILPNTSLYRWKLCEACRTRTRRQTRKRRYGEVDLGSDEDGEDPESIMRRRRSSTVNFKKLKLMFKGETVASVEAHKELKEPISVIVPDNALRFSIYQTPQSLLDSLQERLFGFITATTHYLRFKMTAKMALENVQPTVFSFEGEYSIIADPSGGEVGSKIESVRVDVGKALGMQFTLTSFRVEPNGTIVGQYGCLHEVLVPLPAKTIPTSTVPPESATESGSVLLPSPADTCPKDVAVKDSAREDTPSTKDAPTKESSLETTVMEAGILGDSMEQNPAPAETRPKAANTEPSPPTSDATGNEDVPTNFDIIAKCMAGELKVSILWDRSHRYFPGLRTIVQLNLVG